MSGYPDGYADPPWDGTEAGFRDVVTARMEAIGRQLNAAFADLLPEGVSFQPSPYRSEVVQDEPTRCWFFPDA